MNHSRRRPQPPRRGAHNPRAAALAAMRVVQRNLVYVIGLSPRIADEGMLKRTEFFGQYGEIVSQNNLTARACTTS